MQIKMPTNKPLSEGNKRLQQIVSNVRKQFIKELTSDEVANLINNGRNLDRQLKSVLTGDDAGFIQNNRNLERELKTALVTEMRELAKSKDNFEKALRKILLEELAELARNEQDHNKDLDADQVDSKLQETAENIKNVRNEWPDNKTVETIYPSVSTSQRQLYSKEERISSASKKDNSNARKPRAEDEKKQRAKNKTAAHALGKADNLVLGLWKEIRAKNKESPRDLEILGRRSYGSSKFAPSFAKALRKIFQMAEEQSANTAGTMANHESRAADSNSKVATTKNEIGLQSELAKTERAVGSGDNKSVNRLDNNREELPGTVIESPVVLMVAHTQQVGRSR